MKLPDEYDQIYLDLEPYWGVSPGLLQQMAQETEEVPDTFTIGKANGSDKITLLNLTPRNQQALEIILEQATAQIELIQDVSQWLPPFRATFTIHNRPIQLTNWRLKRAALDAASRGLGNFFSLCNWL